MRGAHSVQSGGVRAVDGRWEAEVPGWPDTLDLFDFFADNRSRNLWNIRV
jgi:hypothetical protein